MTFLDTWNLLLVTWIFIIKYGCSQYLEGLIGHSVIGSLLSMLIQHTLFCFSIFVIDGSSEHLEGLIDHRTIGPFLIVIVRYTKSLIRYNSSQRLVYFWINILKALHHELQLHHEETLFVIGCPDSRTPSCRDRLLIENRAKYRILLAPLWPTRSSNRVRLLEWFENEIRRTAIVRGSKAWTLVLIE